MPVALAVVVAALLVAVAPLALASRLVRPMVSYGRRMPVPLGDLADLTDLTTTPDDPGAIVTALRNDGLGPLRVSRVRYHVRTLSGAEGIFPGIRELAAFLRDHCDAEDDRDYYLLHHTPASTLPPLSHEVLAALTMPFARRLALFRVQLTYRGLVGVLPRRKNIDLVPVDPLHRELAPPAPASSLPA